MRNEPGFVPRETSIRMRGVSKRFGSTPAVNGLDLDVTTGTCMGLLGPNGAGKTTTMRMLTAQAIADEGEIDVLGLPLPERSKEVRAQCGVVPQLDNLDVELTARENLLVFARLYRVPRRERRAAVEAALELAGLVERGDQPVIYLSGGMRRRLLIARGLVHNPRLLLLDEPTIGLDPVVRQELWSLIDELRMAGVTVLMTTHYIEEAERLADSVAIMVKGRIIACAPPADLVAEHAGREVLEIYGPPARLRETQEKAEAAGYVTRPTGLAVAILHAERAGGLDGGERRAGSLEDVYVLLTGEVTK